METKSRYEIIADLEEKKAALINAQASLGLREANLKREVESASDDLKEFQADKKITEQNLKDQLESIEKSLERLNQKSKK